MMWDPRTLVGQQLNAYQLDTFINSGAFGAVYEADDPQTSVRVAVKVLRLGAGAQAQEEFTNEGQLLLKMATANRVLDVFDTNTATVNVTLAGGAVIPLPVRFHVLELADNFLADLTVDPDAIDWPSKLSLFRDVVLAAHQMHCRGVVHRDIKAENVLLFTNGSQVTAKVNDLGRSRDLLAQANLTANYEFGRGDPDFSPPELLWGLGTDRTHCHIACDLYGLGSVLFELILGSGITAISLLPHWAEIEKHRRMRLADRQASFSLRMPEIRAWYEPAFEVITKEVPPAIRHLVLPTLRQLCDPDPDRRFPRVRLGHRGPRDGYLNWLLHRVDSMRITLRNAEWQARRNKK